MALLPGASARDRWIDLADQARAKRQDALADGNHHMAGLWDGHERTLLRNAYDDVPFPDDEAEGGTSEAGFDAGDGGSNSYVKTAVTDDDLSTLLTAANTRPKSNQASVAPKPKSQPQRPAPKVGDTFSGKASFYGTPEDGTIGQPMSNGQLMDPEAMTAAVRPNAIPLGSTVDVSLANDPSRRITVTITDHGMIDKRRSREAGAWVEDSRTKGRIIDLSRGAFEALGVDPKQGLGDVIVTIKKLPEKIRYFPPPRSQAKPSK
jgi:rare lipoprotein A (peptidoglycan hydrolase)